MLNSNRWLVVVLLFIVGLQLVGCGSEAHYEFIEPYSKVKDDDGIYRVTLTEDAARRLQVENAPITEEAFDGTTYKVAPYASLIYDNYGGTWVYLNPDPLTYKRTEVVVDFIEGDKVYLTEGPDVGTELLITSVAEIYGTDTGVGK